MNIKVNAGRREAKLVTGARLVRLAATLGSWSFGASGEDVTLSAFELDGLMADCNALSWWRFFDATHKIRALLDASTSSMHGVVGDLTQTT